jgi:hypothetical protein
MLSFRVRDLDAMLAQLRSRVADVAGETQDWKVSADSAGAQILRAIGSSCGSPPDRNFAEAVTPAPSAGSGGPASPVALRRAGVPGTGLLWGQDVARGLR